MRATPPDQQAPQDDEMSEGQEQPQQGGSAEDAIGMIQKGFEALGKMIQGAGQQVDPQDVKLFQQAVQCTDNFIQSITGPAQGEQAGKPTPSGPIPQNAKAPQQ